MSAQQSRFNLIDEPWIPIRFPDGTGAELGSKDTLLRAKEIAVIEDASPLVVAALHRFLLAVLYRALEGPTDLDQAKGWFKAGLPAGKISAYLRSAEHTSELQSLMRISYAVSCLKKTTSKHTTTTSTKH